MVGLRVKARIVSPANEKLLVELVRTGGPPVARPRIRKDTGFFVFRT
jgi:hypothetical protein